MLKIIIIDCSLYIFRRLTKELDRQGFKFCACLAETPELLNKSLIGGRPDLVLSAADASTPSAFIALDTVRLHYPDVPFVFVSQIYSPGFIVEVFENGGNGLIPMNHLSQMREVITQAQKRNSEALPFEAEAPPVRSTDPGLGDLSNSGIAKPICPRCKRICDLDGDWQAVEIHLRLYRQATVKLGTCPDCEESFASI